MKTKIVILFLMLAGMEMKAQVEYVAADGDFPGTTDFIGATQAGVIWTNDNLGAIVVSSTYTYIASTDPLKTVTLPVVKVGLSDSASLTGVSIPGSVNNIALNSCSNLTSVTIGQGVPYILEQSFQLDVSLPSVVIPDSVTYIGTEAFYGCTSLASVTIGQGVTNIETWAFGHTGLNNVVISDNVTSLGQLVFAECYALTNVTMGNGVTTIDYGEFKDDTNLANVTLSDHLTDIPDDVFYGCTSLTNIMIPNSVTNIGWAFRYSGLTSVTIPDSVISLGSVAFEYCSNLTSVTIGNGVTSIAGNIPGMFAYCPNLTGVTIGRGVTNIEEGEFAGDSSLANVIILGNGVTAYAFNGYTSLTNVTMGNAVTSIGYAAFSESGLTSVTIPDSVTNIGEFAFQSCPNLTSVSIGNGMTSIGDSAFANCTSLTSVTIPSMVTNIGNQMFANCPSLKSIIFLGNAPASGGQLTFGYGGTVVYYYYGTSGWGSTYDGLPTVMLGAPAPQIQDGSSVDTQSGNFHFTVSGVTNQTIVIEASTNLVNWQPIWTNTLSAASATFTDPEWTNYPARYYRAR